MADVTVANTSPGIAGKTLACHDTDGVTTGIWTFANPLALKSGASGSQTWRLSVAAGSGNVNVLADGTGLGLSVNTAGDLYEKGRTTPLGHWIDVPYDAANFSAAAGMTMDVSAANVSRYAYTLTGKTLTLTVQLGAVTLGGTASNEMRVSLPAGLSVAAQGVSTGWMNPALCLLLAAPATTYVSIYKSDLSAWALGTVGPLAFTIVCQIW
jgi:hypothetical protein